MSGSFDWRRLLAAALVASLAATSSVSARAADAEVDLSALVGKRISITLKNGNAIKDAEVTDVVASDEAGAIRGLTVKAPPANRSQKVAVTSIEEITLDGESLDIVYTAKTRTLAHSPERRKQRLEQEAATLDRLRNRRAQLWPSYTEDEQKKFVAEHKEYLETVAKAFSGLAMKLHETQYFLFLTDMPDQQVGGYITNLDQMYAMLCESFGIAKGENIWRGKCVIITFVNENSFREFEAKMMNNPLPPGGAQGIAHGYSDGRVIVGCYRGEKPSYFAKVLVHETAHGFVHRYKSSVHIPSWINEGIADWVAGYIVRADQEVTRRQQRAAEQAKQTRSLGGNFFDEGKNIDAWQYGVASSIVDLMLKGGGKKYREFIVGIKEGRDWEESLQLAYKITPAELVQLYGKAIGVPDLRP